MHPHVLTLDARKKPSVDDIYPRLFDAILEQRIAPASRFTEEGLGELFGVSRSVIRRVLAKLSHQQVVILRPNQRAQVAAPDAQHTRQILEARRLTEITVVQLACAQATAMQIRQLRELIAQERDAIERDQRGRRSGFPESFICNWRTWPAMRHWPSFSTAWCR